MKTLSTLLAIVITIITVSGCRPLVEEARNSPPTVQVVPTYSMQRCNYSAEIVWIKDMEYCVIYATSQSRHTTVINLTKEALEVELLKKRLAGTN